MAFPLLYMRLIKLPKAADRSFILCRKIWEMPRWLPPRHRQLILVGSWYIALVSAFSSWPTVKIPEKRRKYNLTRQAILSGVYYKLNLYPVKPYIRSRVACFVVHVTLKQHQVTEWNEFGVTAEVYNSVIDGN